MKKFNAFSGVFTPSVLTILGVIMYLRLGWVVGEAGIVFTIIIILVAHIISFATGLSISSIATDKKIKVGGIYYILSRSLGLPMGGAIGIALTVGMAFSIALYVVGFLESLLAVEAIGGFFEMLGFDLTSVNTFRILGSVVLVLLTILVFISTSLAIKAQFFIMAAIALSIVSIIVGLSADFSVSNAVWTQPEGGESLIMIFAIFFPAVTGFTAGVSMSGDLKDPKKDIPKGTMLAIIVGFVVYIGLALFIGFTVDGETLKDYNFLSKISWVPFLVLAGIWGATLSSALGGILGSPRITQAIGGDKIIPKFLAKGFGPSNEPRIALFATFAIAEIGILIGNLNAIAEIVSMFYLASYGFINLAFWLESWASTDFRPSFKVPKFVGLVGFIFSFVIMAILNLFAMIISLAIMFIIYMILKRREIRLDFGDVWQSVWTTIIRSILTKMNNKTLEQRNWRPNLILFSGGTNKRQHLIELSKAIVGKYGFLSNFDIIKSETENVLFPKHQQNIIDVNEQEKGIFTRKKTCKNIYEGIETIAATYGFSGVEPDTVMMGWARQTKDPVRFANMIQTLANLDLNIILVDYDVRFGFGKYQLIDIWWRGAGNNGNFTLSLMKFLWTSPQWQDAKLRLMIVNQINSETDNITRTVSEMLDSMRVEAEIRIINNELEKKSFYDIIKVESINTDLTFIGVPPIFTKKEAEFVEKTNDLMHEIGTVILIKASSLFKNMHIGSNPKLFANAEEIVNVKISKQLDLEEIKIPKNSAIKTDIKFLLDNFKEVNSSFINNNIAKFISLNNNLLLDLKKITTKSFSKIHSTLNNGETEIIVASQKNLNTILIRYRKDIKHFNDQVIEQQKQMMQQATESYVKNVDNFTSNVEKYFIRNITAEDLKIDKDDKLSLKMTKNYGKLRLKITGNDINYKIKYKMLVKSYFPFQSQIAMKEIYTQLTLQNFQFVEELQKLQRMLKDRLILLNTKARNKELTREVFYKIKEDIFKQIEKSEKINIDVAENLSHLLDKHTLNNIQHLCNDSHSIIGNNLISLRKAKKKILKQVVTNIENAPSKWSENQKLLFNGLEVDNLLLSFEGRLIIIANEVISSITKTVEIAVEDGYSHLYEYMDLFNTKIKKNILDKFTPDLKDEYFGIEYYLQNFNEILDTAFDNLKLSVKRFPDTIHLLSEQSYSNLRLNQSNKVEVLSIAAVRLVDYIIQDELIDPLHKIIDDLPSQIIEIQSEIQNIIRVITFNLYDEDGNINKKYLKENIEIIETKRIELATKEEKIIKLKKQINLKITERINATVDKLTYQSFIKLSSNFKQYVNKLVKKKRFTRIRKDIELSKDFASNQVNKLWFKQSDALILQEKINKETLSHTKVNDLLDLIEEVSVNEEIFERLPFFYQQLFIRKHNYSSEFWFGRKKELEIARKTIKRYDAGFYGGILIVGKHLSGKTFLANYIASHYRKASELFTINPPYSGSILMSSFKKAVSEATNTRGGIFEIFNKLPYKSTIIFENLELWWEKSEDGISIISLIINIIERFSKKHLFIVNCNINSFLLINKIKKLAPSFLNIIDCEPFNADELKNIILFRHKSSNLKLKLNKKVEKQIKSVDYARFFNKLFRYSNGNIGVSLLTWVANINNYSDKIISVKLPKIPDISALELLDSETKILLVQFILHKRLTLDKAQRVSLQEKHEINKRFNYLKRTGMVMEKTTNVYELNPFIYTHIEIKLQEDGYLY